MATPAPTVLSYQRNGNNLILTWTGGAPPFQVQWGADLNPSTPWVNVGNATIARTRTVPIVGREGYFRVQEQVPLLDADVSQPDVTRLFWSLPDLS